MTRFMTAYPCRSENHPAAYAVEASRFYAPYMNNNAVMIMMGTSALVSIFVMMAAVLRLHQVVLISIVSIFILISMIYLSLYRIPPEETSDLS